MSLLSESCHQHRTFQLQFSLWNAMSNIHHRFLWVSIQSFCSCKCQFPLLVAIVGNSPHRGFPWRSSCVLLWCLIMLLRREGWRWPSWLALHLAIQSLPLTRKYLQFQDGITYKETLHLISITHLIDFHLQLICTHIMTLLNSLLISLMWCT